jgi:hypothetical protein
MATAVLREPVQFDPLIEASERRTREAIELREDLRRGPISEPLHERRAVDEVDEQERTRNRGGHRGLLLFHPAFFDPRQRRR